MLRKKFEPCYVLPKEHLPEGFEYPLDYQHFYKSIHAEELLDGNPWTFLDAHFAVPRSRAMNQRYPARRLVPFAIQQHSDDVACFDAFAALKDSPVVLIHDFADPGWEGRGTFASFEDWLRMVKADTAMWRAEHLSEK